MVGREDRVRLMRGGMAGVLLASTAMAAVPAWAQEQLAMADAPAEAPAAEGDIIVTATRRAEPLQRVPISIQALGGQKLAEQQVSSFDDYAKMLPSVSFNSGGPSQAQIYFRGINSGGDGLDVGSLPTVGLYLDDIPVTTIGSAIDLHIYDINRVEGLAGPQGTLFGASSLAGTLRIITNKPDPSKFEAGYDLEVNKFGKGDFGGKAEGFVNVPLNETMAIRLVGYYERDGGYMDNTFKQRTYELDDKDPNTNKVVDNSAFVGKDLNKVTGYGGRAALHVELNDEWTVTPQIVYQHQKAKGSFLYDPAAGDLKVHDFKDNVNKDEWYQASATIEGKVGNWDLTYSGGYFERWRVNDNDYSYYTVAYDHYSRAAGLSLTGPDSFYYYTKYPDGNGGFIDPSQFSYADYKFTKQTHELRVSSPVSERLRATFGMFLQRQTGKLDTNYYTPGLSEAASHFTQDEWPNPNIYPLEGFKDTVFIKRLDRTDRDYAAFAEANFDITSSLTLTAGIRGFMVKNSLYGFSGITALARNPARCVPAPGRYPCVSVDKVYNESGETHKVSLAWKIDGERMVYATYSTGFRPGGNDRRPGTPAYRADTIDNYEVGWKTSFLNGRARFNGALFHMKWKDIQFSLPGENGQTYLLNAPGGARVNGAEVDAQIRFGGLTIYGSGAYIDAKLTDDFCARAGECTPKGTKLPATPKFKVNGTARYDFDLGDSKAFVQGTVNHQSGTRAGLLDSDTLPAQVIDGIIVYNDPPVAGAPFVDQYGFTKGFTTFDFSIGATFGSMSVQAYIQNAFDKRGILSKSAACGLSECNASARLYPTKPQLFGLRFGQKF